MSTPGELAGRLAAAGLDPGYAHRLVRLAVAEDLAGGVEVASDAAAPDGRRAVVDVVATAPGVVCGLLLAECVLDQVCSGDAAVRRPRVDGDVVSVGDVVLTVSGPAAALLTGERTALNLLDRLSQVAGATRSVVEAVAGTGAVVRATRATTPGLRALEAHAVRVGGGTSADPDGTVLLTRNHVTVAGGVRSALAGLLGADPGAAAEVEVGGVEECAEALDEGVRALLLAGLAPDTTAACVELARRAGRVRVTAGGPLSLDQLRAVALAGVDAVAVDALAATGGGARAAVVVRPPAPGAGGGRSVERPSGPVGGSGG